MQAKRCVYAGLIAVYLCFVSFQPQAQGPATVGAVIIGAQALKATLDSTLANAGAEGRSVVDSANGTIDGAIAQLKALVDNDLSKPVNQLSGTAQAVETQLQNTVDSLNQVLSLQISCGLDGAERLVYSVKTLTSGLQNAIPLIKDSKPYLYSFIFDGQHPGIVPRNGGRLSIQGFSLWPGDTSPSVILVSETERQQIKQLDAGRAADNNAVSVVLDATTITSLSGQCAEFEVTPHTTAGIWPFRSETDMPAMFLPICIPKSITTAVKVRVSSKFLCSATGAPQALNSQEFRCDNSSCEHSGGCNIQHSWNIPAGCTITGTDKSAGRDMRDAQVDTVPIKNVGGNYTAAGTINSASCTAFGGGIFSAGNHLNHSTIWQVNAHPIIQCTTQSWTNAADASSSPQAVTADNAPICVDVVPSCANPDNTSYSATLQLIDANQANNGNTDVQPVASVTTETVTATGGTNQPFKDIEYEGIQFQGSVNPNAGGHPQVCITAKMPQCGL